jgi:SAM-dependent methyltransferase
MERHRSVWLQLDRHPEMLIAGAVVLHVAPERVLGNRLRSIPGADYHGGDLTAEFGPERIDVTDLRFPDRSVDILVCNHVLEHVPDDRKAMVEIHRVLKPGGWALLLVPELEGDSVSETTDEDPSITDPAERLRRFGQDDHVRRYGWDYLDRLREAGLEVEVIRPESEFGTAAVERYRLAKRGAVEPLIFCRPADGSDAERVE